MEIGSTIMSIDASAKNEETGIMRKLAGRFRNDQDGTTAIEFALVALPFLMMAIGIIGLGLYSFTRSSLEHAVETSARKIRTGQLQTLAQTDPTATFGAFKQSICDEAASYIDCGKVTMHIQTNSDWAGVTPNGCLDTSGVQVNSSGQDGDSIGDHSGGAGDVVLVTVCYEWDMMKNVDFLNFGDMANGGTMIQASTAFRTEPYE